MLENHHYNLLEQIVDESKSLWRIKKRYKQDVGDGESWEKLEQDKEDHIKELEEFVRTHLS